MVKLKIRTGPPPPPPPEEPKPQLPASGVPTAIPKIKIKAREPKGPRLTKIRLKRVREPGLGYDSEASDREEDPCIEEQIILRMMPGEDCEYVRKAIENREIGKGADVWVKFKDQRRAVVHVNGHLYGAKLVDLPCVIESNKSFDKKVIFKAADVCQMLLVTGRIDHENDVLNTHLKQSDYVYPHGLTTPMHWVRQKRFRKRVSNRTIEAVENEVDRLLTMDERAISTSSELVDHSMLARDSSVALSEDISFDTMQSAGVGVGDQDQRIPGDMFDGMDEDDLAGQIEQGMLELSQDTRESTAEPQLAGEESVSDEEDEEEEDEEDNEADDETRESKRQTRLVREFISELETSIQKRKKDAEEATNPILRNRFLADVNRMVTELELKRTQLVESDEQIE
ncbi:transcription factor TFIID complex subunit Taf7 [Schizosaccharomyces osmophilus]|uniref:Transcription factor TFIID complex subunit Taf7 n=1 Tax=Schizosaccharomyces osmophilus TaxID=2545709 RepID=A0AAF0AX33_9SCHI|nr:transcription factor TFIID complex subunit Taf7 [Schizosaccharomyces osmophilus]WBW73685.1 transcription factor TFIID complex subunit Taf7 [Schizosaccharomyces osmophilus]